MNSGRPREEDLEAVAKKKFKNDRRQHNNVPAGEEEVIEATLREKKPMPNTDHEEAEPSGLSHDGRM